MQSLFPFVLCSEEGTTGLKREKSSWRSVHGFVITIETTILSIFSVWNGGKITAEMELNRSRIETGKT